MKLLLLPPLLAAAAFAQSTASIKGTLLDAKASKPVPAAWVFANRTALPPLSIHTKSGGDGSFLIQGLTAGTYSLCVQASGDQYLNPCDWGATPTTITVTAGQAVTAVSLKLAAASVVSIQVTDPPKALSQLTADGRHPDLTLGVWGSHGVFYPAHPVGAPPSPSAGAQPAQAPPPGVPVAILTSKPAAVTYTYRLAVPFDTALNFSITSHDLNLADATGLALPANASLQAFQHATGDANPKNFAFSVLGLK